MADGKKDILEFPLEDVEVPQAIALMMQAASKTANLIKAMQGDDCFDARIDIDNDRLQKLCDKLEARVEDAIETGLAPPVLEDAPDEEVVAEGDIFLMNDGLTMNYKGLLFHRTCNKRVMADDVVGGPSFCALPADHNSLVHVDSEGETR